LVGERAIAEPPDAVDPDASVVDPGADHTPAGAAEVDGRGAKRRRAPMCCGHDRSLWPRCSHAGVAPVDDEALADDVAGALAGQVDDEVAQLGGLSHATCGDAADPVLRHLRIGRLEVPGHIAREVPRRDRIDTDAMWPP